MKKNLKYVFEMGDENFYKGERIGQFIWNAMAHAGLWDSPEANPLFFIDDKDFLKVLNNYANSRREPIQQLVSASTRRRHATLVHLAKDGGKKRPSRNG